MLNGLERIIKYVFLVCIVIYFVPSVALGLSARQLYQQVSPSVYYIVSFDMDSKRPLGHGSAVAVTKNVVATNCHVALKGDYTKLKVGKEYKLAGIFYHNRAQDLCLIVVPGAKFKPVKLRLSSEVNVGEDVFAIGNPVKLQRTLSKGVISNRHHSKGGTLLQTDATLAPGSSGGGLFDAKANLIGITTSGYRSKNIAFALPTEWILKVIDPARVKHLDKRLEKPRIKPISTESSSSFLQSLKVVPVGAYGRHQVKLLKLNHRCFIYLSGRDPMGHVQSAALWNPRRPSSIMIFPYSKLLDEAIETLKSDPFMNRITDHLSYSKSFLFLKSQIIQLYGNMRAYGEFPLLFGKFKENPLSELRNGTQFIVQVKKKQGYRTVYFGLWGFGEAYDQYKKQCGR